MTNPAPPNAPGADAPQAAAAAPDAESAISWEPGQPAPDGYVVVPEDEEFGIAEHLAHAELHPGQKPAARAIATEELICAVSGEPIAVGEAYIDGGPNYGPVKIGHENESKRLS